MQKMGWFGVVRGHSRSTAMSPSAYDFLFDFNRNYVSIVYRFRDIAGPNSGEMSVRGEMSDHFAGGVDWRLGPALWAFSFAPARRRFSRVARRASLAVPVPVLGGIFRLDAGGLRMQSDCRRRLTPTVCHKTPSYRWMHGPH